MRDIVYKKVGHTPSAPHTQPQSVSHLPIAPKLKSPSFVESTINRLNLFGGWLRQSLTDSQPVVVTPSKIAPISFTERRAEKRRKRDIAKEKARAFAAAAKERGHSTRKALKTPIGKMALVQATAMLALLVYVVVTRNPHTQTSLADTEKVSSNSGSVRQYLPSSHAAGTPQPFKAVEANIPHGSTTLNAWLTPWNIDELSSQSGSYSSVSAFWLSLADNGYDLIPKADWQQWDMFKASKRQENQKLFLTVSADPNAAYLALTDSTIQEKQISNLLQAVKDHGFDGIDIDYEGLGSDNRDLFTSFTRNLTAAFHAEQKTVAITLEARIANQVPMDWRNIGLIADEVRIMVYDYHSHSTSFPGPIAPLSWVKEVADYAVSNINPSKIIIGLGNYGYDWQQDNADGTSWSGTGISFDQAMALAKDRKAPVIQASGIDDRGYDIGIVPTFTYKDDSGNQHAVWFEDKESLQSKVDLVSQYPIQGVIFWSVGLGDKEFWQTRPAVNK